LKSLIFPTSFHKKTIRDVDVQSKRIFLRCDFNVPLQKGQITDDRRIRESLPTIQHLLTQNAKVILASHLGRPKEVSAEFSLLPVSKALSEMLGIPIPLLKNCVGKEVEDVAAAMEPGSCVLPENVRFHPEEEANDPEFAKALSGLAELFVNDAFGTMHRAHASTAGIAQYLPAVAGFLVEKELNAFQKVLGNPKRPIVLILGGAKVHDKVGVIENLLPKVDKLLIGGGCAFTFLKAKGYEIGKSLVDKSQIDFVSRILKDFDYKIVIPSDIIIAQAPEIDAMTTVVDADHIPANMMGLDIGPKTQEIYSAYIKNAATIIWNGPMGYFEIPAFAEGTYAIGMALQTTKALSIVGGGDSAAAMEQLGMTSYVSHISTGGGATLEFLEGHKLPGLECLMDRDDLPSEPTSTSAF